MIRSVFAAASLIALALAGCAAPADDIAGAGTRADGVGVFATPNLIVTGATRTSTCSLGQCTVRFNVTVQNNGTATAINPYAGADWATTALPVSGCSSAGGSTWKAIGYNGTNLAPGASMSILVYGPGYVGPKVSQGSSLSVKFGADPCGNTAESSESDNTTTIVFTV
jgi:hypothetical protein